MLEELNHVLMLWEILSFYLPAVAAGVIVAVTLLLVCRDRGASPSQRRRNPGGSRRWPNRALSARRRRGGCWRSATPCRRSGRPRLFRICRSGSYRRSGAFSAS